MRKIFLSMLVIYLFCFISCSTDHLPLEPELTLSVADVSCTEVWLKAEGIGSNEFILERDGSEIENYSVISGNIIYDDSLRPNTRYSYCLTRLSDDERSRGVTATTLDTTSHDFTWQTYTFGDYSSVLRDVAIVNEDNIWAVGEIYFNDSTGQPDPNLYNAVHWDGQQWEMMRIPTNSVVGLGFYPINTVFAFDADNIWMFSDAGSYCHWNGTIWQSQYVPERQGGINKIWGSSPIDIYFVGTNGNITHYNGQRWQKLESGTELSIMDIYGARKNESGQYEILCVAEHISPGASKILSIEGTNVRELSTPGLLSWGLWGIWFVPTRHYIVVGSGVWRSHSLETSWALDNRLPTLFSTSIDGKDLNDVVVAGAFWLLAHFNGMNWQTYFPVTSGSFGGVVIRGDLVIAVGDIGNSAVVVRGKRL